MKEGESNSKGMKLIEKTDQESSTHPHAKIWIMECETCNSRALVNSCDAHERLCPQCHSWAAPSDGLELQEMPTK